MSDTATFRVLVLCAHNRTRSVIAGALLRSYLDDRFEVETAGFGPEGKPALPQAVDLLAERGIDVTAHRSRRVDRDMVQSANLVLTAEKSQVLSVVAELGGEFDRTFTLPEFAQAVGSGGERARGSAYMKASVPEVADPTGLSAAAWTRAWTDIDGWTAMVATYLERQVAHDPA